MTLFELDKIEARAKAALTYERSEYVPEEGMYVSPATEGGDTEEVMTCPLCNGDGSVEGQRYDSKEEYASTIVAYGIGKGLGLAEEWVENGPKDTFALVAEVKRLTAEVEMLRGVGCMEEGDGPCGVCRKCAFQRGVAKMREAAVEACRPEYPDAVRRLRALPDPEDK